MRDNYKKYLKFKSSERFSAIMADQTKDLEVLEEAVRYWAEKDNNPENPEVIFDRYRNIAVNKTNPALLENTGFYITQEAFNEEKKREWERLNRN